MKAIKTVRALAAVAAFSALASGAWAQSLSQGVTVQVSLASKCRVKAGATPVVDFGTYTAFQAVKTIPNAASVVFECTRGFGGSPTAAWDTTNGTAAGVGVLAGLQYTLTVSGGARAGGGSATTSALGTPDLVTYTVDAEMPGDQAGAGATATVNANHTRTLLVTF
jgi:hypothetical protein